jgi:signal transduction histidine kinase
MPRNSPSQDGNGKCPATVRTDRKVAGGGGGRLLPNIKAAAELPAEVETAGWWALDVSRAQAIAAAIIDGAGPPNWSDALLEEVRVADADDLVAHLIGPHGGRQQMIGESFSKYSPPEVWQPVAELILAIMADDPGAERSRDVTSLSFGDCRIYASTDAAHPNIFFLAVTGTLLDHRSFWSVRASEERYRSLIRYLPGALLQVDSRAMTGIFKHLRARGITDIAAYLDTKPEMALHSRNIVRVTDANVRAVDLFGADSIESLVAPVDYVFAASPETAKRVITAHFNGDRTHTEIMKLRTFDGRIRDVELSVTYPTPPERVDVTLLTLEDVTDRLRTEAQLRQLQADYSRAARISMMGELAASIAHEVNQPLSAIVTNAETSLRWLSRPDRNLAKVGQLTTRIVASARHASDIVQRIRGMAAPRPPERVKLDFNRIVEEARLFIQHEMESRSIDLNLRLGRNLPALLGDRVQLQQVIVNLLLNAVHAVGLVRGATGQIDICTDTNESGDVRFTIHDGGPGIAQENMDRIFGSFFTTKEEGIGIGLAICQSIITAHGGVISASNHPLGGAIFQFTLPAAAKS